MWDVASVVGFAGRRHEGGRQPIYPVRRGLSLIYEAPVPRWPWPTRHNGCWPRACVFPAMIFDPALAAAARRHQRAKNKAQKSPTDAENTSTSASNNSTLSSSSSSAPAAGKEVGAEETNPDGNPAPASTSAAESGELGGSVEARDFRVGDKAGSSSSVGEEGTGSDVGAAAGTRSRTASGSSTWVDFEGATARVRAGGGVSRQQRPLKPRVLLKIVVLGCSNVS